MSSEYTTLNPRTFTHTHTPCFLDFPCSYTSIIMYSCYAVSAYFENETITFVIRYHNSTVTAPTGIIPPIPYDYISFNN